MLIPILTGAFTMADYLAFTEGKNYLESNGLPSTTYFLLSTRDCSTHVAGDTLVGGVGEISGTGYARQSQAEPTPSSGTVTFAQMSWATSSATNWPASVKSCVLVTTSDNSGKALCAWNLQAGGAARDMSSANTTLNFTPAFSMS